VNQTARRVTMTRTSTPQSPKASVKTAKINTAAAIVRR
jgi:hypothetical protein